MSMISGRFRVRRSDGTLHVVAVDNEGVQSDRIPADEYIQAGYKPPIEELEWRDELPPSPGGAEDDFDAERGSDASIRCVYRPEVDRTGGGTIMIDWDRRVSDLELTRYQQGSWQPSWVMEYEKIYSSNILEVSDALKAADPKNEEELAKALEGHSVIRNYRIDRE